MPIRQPTMAEISALQMETGEGRVWCHRELRRHFTCEHLKQASTLDELKEVLLTITPTPEYPDRIITALCIASEPK